MMYAMRVQVQFVQFRTKSRTTTNNNDDDDDEYALHIMHYSIEQVFYSKDSVHRTMNYLLGVVCHCF